MNPENPTEKVLINLFFFFKLETSNKHVIKDTNGIYKGIPILLEMF